MSLRDDFATYEKLGKKKSVSDFYDRSQKRESIANVCLNPLDYGQTSDAEFNDSENYRIIVQPPNRRTWCLTYSIGKGTRVSETPNALIRRSDCKCFIPIVDQLVTFLNERIDVLCFRFF